MNILLIYLSLCISMFFTNNKKNDPSMPKNIILMIGDGMGLSQISAAMYVNNGELS